MENKVEGKTTHTQDNQGAEKVRRKTYFPLRNHVTEGNTDSRQEKYKSESQYYLSCTTGSIKSLSNSQMSRYDETKINIFVFNLPFFKVPHQTRN